VRRPSDIKLPEKQALVITEPTIKEPVPIMPAAFSLKKEDSASGMNSRKGLFKKSDSMSEFDAMPAYKHRTVRISASLGLDANELEVTVGAYKFVIDIKTQKTDTNGNMDEYLLGSLAASLAATARDVSQRINFSTFSVVFQITAEYGTKFVFFQKVKLRALVNHKESEAKLLELQNIVQTECPIFTMFKAAGVELDSRWEG